MDIERKYSLQDLHLRVKHLYLVGAIKDSTYRGLSDTLDSLYEKEGLVFSLKSYLQTVYNVICSFDPYDLDSQDKRMVDNYSRDVDKFIKTISEVYCECGYECK